MERVADEGPEIMLREKEMTGKWKKLRIVKLCFMTMLTDSSPNNRPCHRSGGYSPVCHCEDPVFNRIPIHVGFEMTRVALG